MSDSDDQFSDDNAVHLFSNIQKSGTSSFFFLLRKDCSVIRKVLYKMYVLCSIEIKLCK